jgi:nitrous-oxide reductase
MSRPPFRAIVVAFAVAASALLVTGCSRARGVGDNRDAAQRVYVAPGEYDEFYAFLSGGFDGHVGVYGLPSGRLLRHIPVFSQHAENGWGYSEQTKPMLATSTGRLDRGALRPWAQAIPDEGLLSWE